MICSSYSSNYYLRKNGSIPVFLFFLLVTNLAMAQKTMSNVNKYVKVPSGFVMVLRQGENVLTQLEELAVKENIPAASFTGLGFVNIKFGYFNSKTKEYEPREFKDVELVSLTGSIAWQDDKPSLHAHGVVADKNFKAYGGHLLEAIVGTGSVELFITLHDKPLQRMKEQPLDANVLNLGEKQP